MANRYWVGGTGTWSTSTTNWSASSGGASGASAPTAADSVFFDQAGTYTVTMTGTLTCLDITVSAGTVTFTSTGALTVSGSMSLLAGTLWSATGTITFNATTSKTITTNAVTINSPITLNGVGGTWALGSNLTLGVTRTTTLTNGTLDLNGFNLITGAFVSSGTTTRAIVFGTNTIDLTHTTPATVALSMADATGFTYTGTGGFTTDMTSAYRTYVFGTTGGSTTNAPNLSFTAGSSGVTLNDGSWFKTLDFTGSTSAVNMPTTVLGINIDTLTLATGGTYTGLIPVFTRTQTWTPQFSKQLGGIGVSSAGVTLTLENTQTYTTNSITILTAGTLDLGGYDLTTGTFVSSNSNTRSITFGTNNIILAVPGAGATNLSMATATGFTYTGTGGFQAAANFTRTFTFGTTGGSATNSPNLTLTSGSSIQTLTTGSWFNKLDFGTAGANPGTTSLNLNSLTLSATGTYATLTATMRGTGTITSNGNITLVTLTINHTGTTTLGAAFTLAATGTTTLTSGTLDLNGFNLTTGIFNSNNSNTRAISFDTDKIVLTHPTAATTVLEISTATGFTWTGTTGGFQTDSSSVARTLVFGTGLGGSITNSPNLSLTGTSAILTFTTGSWFNNLDFGTTTFNPGTTVLNLNSLTLSATGTYTTLTANMVGTGTINCNGKSTGPLIINNGAGTTTLSAAALCTTFTMTAGAINFATFNLTCSTTAAYTAGTLTNIGTISCTTFTVTGTFTLTQGTITASTGFILTSGVFNYNGGTLTATPAFTHTAGTVTLGQNLALTVTGTYTLTAGTLALAGYTLSTGIFSSSNTNTRTITFGSGNISLTHTTAATTVLSMATATNFSLTGTGGFTTSAAVTKTLTFGTTGGSATNSPNVTFTGSGTSVATFTTGSYFNTLSFGTTAFTIGTTALNLNGLTLSSGGTFSTLTPTMRGTGTVTPNGKTVAALTVNHSGTTTFAGALACTTYTQTAGAVDFATFNLTGSGAAAYTAGTLTNIGTISCTSFTVTGTFTLTQGTITPSTSFVLTSGAFNYNGGTLSAVPTFTHTAGTVTLGQAYALTATGTYTLTAGTLNLAGFTLTVGIFSSTNTNVRTLAFGAGSIALVHTTAATVVLDLNTATNLSVSGTGGFTTTAATTRTFTFPTIGNTVANSPNLTFTGSGTAQPTFNSGWIKNLDFGTTATTLASATLNLSGLTLSTGGTYTSLTVNTIGTGTLTTNGKTIVSLTVNCSGATTTLGSALSFTAATVTTTLTAGTLDLNGFTLTTGIFSSTSAVVRAIAFGTGTIALAHTTAATTVLSMANASNFTVTGAGGFTAVMSVTRTFVFGTTGGSPTNSPNLTLSSGSSVATITTASWFNTLSFGTSSGIPTATALNLNGLTLGSATAYTNITPTFVGPGTITPNSKSLTTVVVNTPPIVTAGGSLYFRGNAYYTGEALAANQLTGDYTVEFWFYQTVAGKQGLVTITNTTSSGANGFSVYIDNTNSLTMFIDGNTTTVTSTTNIFTINTWNAIAVVYVASSTQAKLYLNGTSVATLTRSSTWPATPTIGIGRIFNDNVGSTFSGYMSNLRILKGTALYTTTYTPPTTPLTAITNTYLLNLQNATVTDNSGNGLTFSTAGAITQNENSPFTGTSYSASTTTLAGSLTTNTSFTLTSGNLDITGDTLTPTQFISAGGVVGTARSITGGGTGIISLANDWSVTNGSTFTGSGYTINMTSASSKTFGGSGGAYGTLVQAGAGALTISGSNSFEDIQATTQPSTVTFTAGTTQTVAAFTLSGISGSQVTVNSTTNGTQYTLSKSSGAVSPVYISIRDSNVTGGAIWNISGVGVVDVSNNTGWSSGVFAALSGVSAFGNVQTILALNEQALTGTAASGFVGTISLDSLLGVDGVSALFSVGAVSADNSVALTYVLASGFAGTISAESIIDTTGVPAFGTVGTVGPSGDVTLQVTSVLGSGSVGDLSAAITNDLSNVLASGFAGTTSLNSLIGISGVLAEGAVNTISFQLEFPLTNVVASGNVGTVQFGNGFDLTGVPASGLAGTVQFGKGFDLTGVPAVGDVGTVQFGKGFDLTGVLALGQAGNLQFGNAFGLSGVLGSGFVGDVQFGNAYNLTSVLASGNVGTPQFGKGFDLTGVLASGAVNTLQLTRNSDLTGDAAVGGVGSVQFGNGYGLTGVQAAGVVGSLANASTYAIFGMSATGTAQSLFSGKTFGITGAGGTGSVGTLLFGRSFGLTGVLASGVVENIVLANTVGVDGVLSSGTVGIVVAITPDIVRSITGVSASGAVGNVVGDSPDRVIAITSVAALAAVGVVIGVYPDKSIAVTGVQASGTTGNLVAVYWQEVDDAQNPNWVTPTTSQTPAWVDINTTTASDWETVDTAQ